MCCGFQKSTIKLLGWILSLGFFAAAVICIILAGVNFNTLFTSFKTGGGWQSLAAVEIASIVYVLVLCGLGVLTFCCDWWCLTLIFAILIVISAVFTGAIAIFGLVGGSIGKVDTLLGCQTTYTGVLDAWNHMDSYLQEVDQSFCGGSCKCYISNTAPYLGASQSVQNSYAQWKTTTLPTDATAFQNCTEQVQTDTLAAYETDISPATDADFSQSLFATYWGDIEQKFNCTGWCQNTYSKNNGIANSPQSWTINKYLFSDINRGIPPTSLGCLNSIVTWLPPILNAFGAIALVVTALEIVVFLLALSLCCSKENKNTNVSDKQ